MTLCLSMPRSVQCSDIISWVLFNFSICVSEYLRLSVKIQCSNAERSIG